MRAATSTRGGPVQKATRRPPGRDDSHKNWPDRRGPVNPSSHLVKFGQRLDSPTVGYWTQQDPLDQIDNVSQSNRYAYASDDPINQMDPTGEDNMFDETVGTVLGAAVCFVTGVAVSDAVSTVADPLVGAAVGGVAGACVGSAVAGVIEGTDPECDPGFAAATGAVAVVAQYINEVRG